MRELKRFDGVLSRVAGLQRGDLQREWSLKGTGRETSESLKSEKSRIPQVITCGCNREDQCRESYM